MSSFNLSTVSPTSIKNQKDSLITGAGDSQEQSVVESTRRSSSTKQNGTIIAELATLTNSLSGDGSKSQQSSTKSSLQTTKSKRSIDVHKETTTGHKRSPFSTNTFSIDRKSSLPVIFSQNSSNDPALSSIGTSTTSSMNNRFTSSTQRPTKSQQTVKWSTSPSLKMYDNVPTADPIPKQSVNMNTIPKQSVNKDQQQQRYHKPSSMSASSKEQPTSNSLKFYNDLPAESAVPRQSVTLKVPQIDDTDDSSSQKTDGNKSKSSTGSFSDRLFSIFRTGKNKEEQGDYLLESQHPNGTSSVNDTVTTTRTDKLSYLQPNLQLTTDSTIDQSDPSSYSSVHLSVGQVKSSVHDQQPDDATSSVKFHKTLSSTKYDLISTKYSNSDDETPKQSYMTASLTVGKDIGSARMSSVNVIPTDDVITMSHPITDEKTSTQISDTKSISVDENPFVIGGQDVHNPVEPINDKDIIGQDLDEDLYQSKKMDLQEKLQLQQELEEKQKLDQVYQKLDDIQEKVEHDVVKLQRNDFVEDNDMKHKQYDILKQQEDHLYRQQQLNLWKNATPDSLPPFKIVPPRYIYPISPTIDSMEPSKYDDKMEAPEMAERNCFCWKNCRSLLVSLLLLGSRNFIKHMKNRSSFTKVEGNLQNDNLKIMKVFLNDPSIYVIYCSCVLLWTGLLASTISILHQSTNPILFNLFQDQQIFITKERRASKMPNFQICGENIIDISVSMFSGNVFPLINCRDRYLTPCSTKTTNYQFNKTTTSCVIFDRSLPMQEINFMILAYFGGSITRNKQFQLSVLDDNGKSTSASSSHVSKLFCLSSGNTLCHYRLVLKDQAVKVDESRVEVVRVVRYQSEMSADQLDRSNGSRKALKVYDLFNNYIHVHIQLQETIKSVPIYYYNYLCALVEICSIIFIFTSFSAFKLLEMVFLLLARKLLIFRMKVDFYKPKLEDERFVIYQDEVDKLKLEVGEKKKNQIVSKNEAADGDDVGEQELPSDNNVEDILKSYRGVTSELSFVKVDDKNNVVPRKIAANQTMLNNDFWLNNNTDQLF